eukprot:SAG22_NODE_4129_length_1374_cov_4.066667_2_plen_187_part_00
MYRYVYISPVSSPYAPPPNPCMRPRWAGRAQPGAALAASCAPEQQVLPPRRLPPPLPDGARPTSRRRRRRRRRRPDGLPLYYLHSGPGSFSPLRGWLTGPFGHTYARPSAPHSGQRPPRGRFPTPTPRPGGGRCSLLRRGALPRRIGPACVPTTAPAPAESSPAFFRVAAFGAYPGYAGARASAAA